MFDLFSGTGGLSYALTLHGYLMHSVGETHSIVGVCLAPGLCVRDLFAFPSSILCCLASLAAAPVADCFTIHMHVALWDVVVYADVDLEYLLAHKVIGISCQLAEWR